MLLNNYNNYKSNKDYQNQFQSGIDFFESMIKFFAVLNISVLKTTNDKLFKKVIANNFKDKPSLGDFKSSASHPFIKITKNINKNQFYNFIENIFKKEKINLELDTISSIKEEENKQLKTHIQTNLSNATFSYIIRKPSIGKSALMAKLLEELKEESKELKPFIFYARNSNTGGNSNEKIKTLYSKIESFIRDILNDKQLTIESESINDKFEVESKNDFDELTLGNFKEVFYKKHVIINVKKDI